MQRPMRFRRVWILVAVVSLAMGLLAPTALADHDPDDGGPPADGSGDTVEPREDASQALIDHDSLASVISSEPTAKNVKNVDERGRGERNDAGATTDVWALGNYAYTGTFNSPCGGDPEAGIWIWDVKNSNKTDFVGIIPSPTGSRSNDVKAAAMNSGDPKISSRIWRTLPSVSR